MSTTDLNLSSSASGTDAPSEVITTSLRLRYLAARRPDLPAVQVDEQRLTYGTLNRRVDELAARLLADLGLGDQCIGLQCEGTIEMFVGALGISRAGKISVPIDPTAPPERVSTILKDVEACLLLSDVGQDDIGVELARPSLHTAPIPAGGVDAPMGRIASVVFTSGSTGVPKGIVIPLEHRVNLRQASIFSTIGEIHEGEVIGSLAAGTVGFAEVLVHSAVHLGVTLDAYEIRRLGLGPLAAWLERSKVRGFVTVPTVLRYLLPTLPAGKIFPNLDAVILTGETATWEDVRELWPHLREGALVYNFFGLTETNAVAVMAIAEIPEGATGPLPAGRPVPGVSLTIVDEDGAKVTPGERGEIVVEGSGCTLGYWRRPELTARTFSVLPDGTRRVRTGDAGRWRRDGLLEHLGRLDHVVKVSGHRIDLGDIEANLRTVKGVASAAAAAYEDAEGNTRLLAFAVAQPGHLLHPWALRAALARRLPGPMLPDRVELVEVLPQLPNGKVDRSRLPRIVSEPSVDDATASSGLQRQLAGLMAKILDLASVAPGDDFFQLGGDSLRAARLFTELETNLGIVRPVSMLLEASTPRALASAIEAGAETLGLLLPIQVEGQRPPLFVVHDGAGEVYYAGPLAAALGGDQPVYGIQPPLFFDADAAESTIEELATRYVAEVRRFRSSGPYLLYGHSLGGLIAYEMARQFQLAGAAVGLLGLGDSSAPPAPRDGGRWADFGS